MADSETGFHALSTVMQSIADLDQSLDAKIQSVLETAAEELGFPIAYFTDIDDQTQRIVAAVGNHDEVYEGTVDPIDQTYCRKTVESDSPVIVTDAEAAGWADDPAYQQFGFSCYVGATVTVGSETYGTICFADETPRPDIDPATLRPTVESLARIIGYEIDRTRRAETVNRQERRYRNLFEDSRDAILLLDLDGIRECNESARELFAVESKDQLIGNLPGDLSPPSQPDRRDSTTSFAEHVETATREGEAFFQWQFRRPSGETFRAEVKLSRVEFDDETLIHTHIRDIAERKQRRHELRLFKNALEQAGHGVVITNRDGEIQYVNPAYEQDTGYDREEILGKDPRISKSGKHDDRFYEKLWETISAGEIWETDELINRRKSGELYHVDQTIAPITDDSGEITHFVGIQRDITDLRLREQRLNVLNRILRHNLRNCMTVIQGNLSAIEAMVDDTEALQTHLTPINNRIEDLISISDKASKLESLFDDNDDTDTRVDLKAVVEYVETELSSEYPKASITTTVPETEVTVNYDNGIYFAISEAVENAIIHNNSEPEDVAVTVELLMLPTWIAIRVQDNGPGIPKQDRKSLEVGEETEITHASSIGLWAMYWIVKASGGDVMLSDNDPSGTIVDMVFPRGRE